MKITGYLDVEPGDEDPTDSTGVTNEFYEQLAGISSDRPEISIGNLEDLEVKPVKD